MNALARIERMKQRLPDTKPNAMVDYFLSVADVVYTTEPGKERERRLAALPPEPIPQTADEISFQARLRQAYPVVSPAT